MNKAKYLYSSSSNKGLEMTFEYKGYTYIVIRAFTYPESERKQHLEEQSKIDNKIKYAEKMKQIEQKDNTEQVDKSLESFFKIIEM